MVIERILRAGEGKILRKLTSIAHQVNAIEEDFVAMSDEELRHMTVEFRERLGDGETLDDILVEAFAAAREAAKRTLGQRHFDVQIMGGGALHLGNIAEMKTGEGKTLTSVLAVYLNALSSKGVHVVTTNDYLAKRDSEWMGRVHRFLGLTVGCILAQMPPDQRKEQYACDITYGTNNEFGFDYLRDNMAWSAEELVQRGHNFAVVDEVDSILIDEARTPLIISGPAEQSAKWYAEFSKVVQRLVPGVDKDDDSLDYMVDEKKRTVAITERGVAKVEDYLGIDNLYEAVNTPLVGYLNNALKAKELYKRDRDYVVSPDREVLIVDEFTGRILHGRRYNEGMHQAIEAKEGVPIQDENQTLATITLQNYFRLYDKLAGMTGTAMTEAAEFSQIYKLGVVPIPTNRPMVRRDESDVVYKSEAAKWDSVVNDIVDRHEKGQPVLVGTVSVEKSEHLSGMLLRRGIPHEVLNAKYHEKEAAIIAQAGRKGSVTVATNMAGRGTDIMLGGNPEFLAADELRNRGLSPVDNAEDYEQAWPDTLGRWQSSVKSEHEEVVELGGLYVLATERHESRRIDNQLRGRSGRQGDPGESRFYLSLGDDLMRLFNSAAVERIMDTLNIPEEVPIESKIVSRAIRSAQTQVEQQNFEIRKNVLKYDEVLNKQRTVIYDERRKVLEGADLHEQVRNMIDDVVEAYVTAATAEGYPEEWDLDQLWTALKTLYPVGMTVDDAIREAGGEDGDRSGLTAEFLMQQLQDDAQAAYDKREAELGEDVARELERRVVLSVLDRKWREHLYEMDYLQEGIGLRSFGQRDPLIEYQREGFTMFAAMLEGIKEESVGFLFNVEVQVDVATQEPPAEAQAVENQSVEQWAQPSSLEQEPLPASPPIAQSAPAPAPPLPEPVAPPAAPAPAAPAPAAPAAPAADSGHQHPQVLAPGLGPQRPQQLQYTAPSVDGEAGVMHAAGDGHGHTGPPGVDTGPVVHPGQVVGSQPSRNAPCPCGSGKKYKRCHGDPRNRAAAAS